MGNETEFETRNGKQDDTRYIFNKKREKQGKNWKKQGKKQKKNGNKTGRKTGKKRKKTGKNRKNRKLQEIQKRDIDKVPGNGENGNEF